MKRKLEFAALLFVITGFFISCEKDDATAPVKTKTELITSATWKRTALISHPAYDWNADGTSDTNVLNIMFPCEIDNFETYQVNGFVVTNEGPTKCDPTLPQTWTVTWAFKDNESKVVFDGTDEYILVELTETTLKLRSTFVENGVSYTHYESYGH